MDRYTHLDSQFSSCKGSRFKVHLIVDADDKAFSNQEHCSHGTDSVVAFPGSGICHCLSHMVVDADFDAQ